MRKVLVAGGAGYIGSHTCKSLHDAGYEPVALDNLASGRRDFVRWGPFVEADIRHSGALIDAMRAHGVTDVVHFASLISVGESVADPSLYYDVNVGGSLALLHAMRVAGVNRIVFSSSAAVYGVPLSDTLDESHPLAPINPYGRSKHMVEAMLRDHAAAYGLRARALRYFNACGADASAELGESHSPETHLIPLALSATQAGFPPLRVFGSDYDTPDGTCIRDYIHVTDLASAHVHALQSLDRGDAATAWNVGTGRGHSVSEIIAAIERVTGLQVNREDAPRRLGDPAKLVANPGLIQRETSWRPVHSSIENIVATAWAWHRRDGFAR